MDCEIVNENQIMMSGITKEEALEEFKAGMIRSLKQYEAGLTETFDNMDDFLSNLHSSE